MIVLDSNVISALMKVEPDPVVTTWLDAQLRTSVWTTSICVFEIRIGVYVLPRGKRRQFLDVAFERVLHQALAGRVLDFDTEAATAAAEIKAQLQSNGVGIEWRDLQIAGIVAKHQATLATRNVKHFHHTGVAVVNPWEHAEHTRR